MDSETYKLHRRFDRMGRLIGDDSMTRLFNSHVMVVGLGGVGSWAAESLARSGIGKLTLIDFDEICVTNFNRQLHALQGQVGRKKSEVMQERISKINPQAKVIAHPEFVNADTCERLIPTTGEGRPDFIVDAIDSITSKCFLISYCKKNSIPLVVSTGSGGRMDPTQVQVKDLCDTTRDPLAKAVRRILREQYGFGDDGPWGIPAVYSEEQAAKPMELHYDGGKGFKCVCPQGENTFFNCDNRNLIMGNASFVTGAFGFACASVVVRALLEKTN